MFLAIAGPSGSGKSTLLNLIGCIDTPTSGRLWIDGEEVADAHAGPARGLRARAIGFIFQTFNLFPVLTAAENVEYPLLKRNDIDARERRARVRHFLDSSGSPISPSTVRISCRAASGSGSRSPAPWSSSPRIVLADEPTANLDHKTGKRILRLMRRINRTTGTTFVFSTHDPKVLDMADRRVDLEDGKSSASACACSATGRSRPSARRTPRRPSRVST